MRYVVRDGGHLKRAKKCQLAIEIVATRLAYDGASTPAIGNGAFN